MRWWAQFNLLSHEHTGHSKSRCYVHALISESDLLADTCTSSWWRSIPWCCHALKSQVNHEKSRNKLIDVSFNAFDCSYSVGVILRIIIHVIYMPRHKIPVGYIGGCVNMQFLRKICRVRWPKKGIKAGLLNITCKLLAIIRTVWQLKISAFFDQVGASISPGCAACLQVLRTKTLQLSMQKQKCKTRESWLTLQPALDIKTLVTVQAACNNLPLGAALILPSCSILGQIPAFIHVRQMIYELIMH
jgi:hypothetical protein